MRRIDLFKHHHIFTDDRIHHLDGSTMSDDLRDRLRRLREVQTPPIKTSPASRAEHASGPPKDAARRNDGEVDEVTQLLQRVTDEVDLENSLQSPEGSLNRSPAYLSDFKLSDVDESLIPVPAHSSFGSWARETKAEVHKSTAALEKQADSARGEWKALQKELTEGPKPDGEAKSAVRLPASTHAETTATPVVDGKLIKQAKDRPVLSKHGSGGNSVDLQSDLADAMGDLLAADDRPASVPQPADQENEDVDTEAGKLLARLIMLRGPSPTPDMNHPVEPSRASKRNDEEELEHSLSLPEVPDLLPVQSSNEQELRKDLSSFSKLIRLNAVNAEPDSLQARLDALKAKEQSIKKPATSRTPSSKTAIDKLRQIGLPQTPTDIGSGSRRIDTDGDSGSDRGDEEEDEDDMDSWCIICNEDAALRCIGCDGDLYCSPCWVVGHERMPREEMRQHKTAEYTPRRLRGKRKPDLGSSRPSFAGVAA